MLPAVVLSAGDGQSMHVLVVGNTDGIGLALTRKLLERGDRVVGISRRPSRFSHPNYQHLVADVTAAAFREALVDAITILDPLDAAIHCAGIGEPVKLDDLAAETHTFNVNLMGTVVAVEVIIEALLKAGRGHFVGLSSMADAIISPLAPGYNASKAGMSAYLEGMALAVREHGVSITNVRLGFVDTKMAKSAVRPFMVTADDAASRVLRILDRPKPPIRLSYPLPMAVSVAAMASITWLRILLGV